MDGGLILSGDAPSDSPGHCAKYNSYTMLESRINRVIDMQLVQVHSENNCDILHAHVLFINTEFIIVATYVFACSNVYVIRLIPTNHYYYLWRTLPWELVSYMMHNICMENSLSC